MKRSELVEKLSQFIHDYRRSTEVWTSNEMGGIKCTVSF